MKDKYTKKQDYIKKIEELSKEEQETKKSKAKDIQTIQKEIDNRVIKGDIPLSIIREDCEKISKEYPFLSNKSFVDEKKLIFLLILFLLT